ncbi:unnamed protein product [Meloidogyne enterolobii]|uniref:Uncharacterized protein n=1 Tax=Meloidogyne enterolobii TaxID=390850 RepID=A0ACB0ZAQ8_MELEN
MTKTLNDQNFLRRSCLDPIFGHIAPNHQRLSLSLNQGPIAWFDTYLFQNIFRKIYISPDPPFICHYLFHS